MGTTVSPIATLDQSGENVPSGSRTAAIGALTASLLERPTTKQRLLTRLMHSTDNRFQPFCLHLTRAECDASRRANGDDLSQQQACSHIHFVPDPMPQTDASLGHCSYLSTCHRRKTCRYLHFRIERLPDPSAAVAPSFEWHAPYAPDSFLAQYASVLGPRDALLKTGLGTWLLPSPVFAPQDGTEKISIYVPDDLLPLATAHPPAQWIHCDVRNFELGPVLGKGLWDVVMLDPPWDIHMSLPYGVLSDAQLLDLQLGQLQSPGGLLFIWVTGRAMDIARDCLADWGYARIDEVVWIKTGHTQRLVRTGRTGHWINHSKEHCLVAIKLGERPIDPQEQDQQQPYEDPPTNHDDGGDAPLSAVPLGRSSSTLPPASGGRPRPALPPGTPPHQIVPRWALRGLSADALVSEVRDTSRKPDELYGMIERLAPGGRKLELFGRRHNLRPGWLTLGNQIRSTYVLDADLAERLRQANVGAVAG